MIFASGLLLLVGLTLSECKTGYETCVEAATLQAKVVDPETTQPPGKKFTAQLYVMKNGETSECSGVLVNAKYVLTAAHCVLRTKGKAVDIKVVLGANPNGQNKSSQIVRYANDVLMPKFNPRTQESDIALVQLSHSVKFSDAIGPCCLGAPTASLVNEVGILCGLNVEGIEQYAQVEILDDKECAKELKTKFNKDVMLCTRCVYAPIGTCLGTTGGRLLRRNAIVGIITDVRCCDFNYPAVFTRVEHFDGWIREKAADGGAICSKSVGHWG